MKKTILFLVFLFSATYGFAATLSLVDMKKISGDYSNAKGDTLSVILTTQEKDAAQPDLFGSGNTTFEIVFSPKDTRQGIYGISLDETDYLGQIDGDYVFSYTSDCTDPGCANYESRLKFRPKKNGGYAISLSLDISLDVEEDLAEKLGEEAEPQTEDQMATFCSSRYGVKDASGQNENGGADCYFYLRYFLTTTAR